MLERTIEDTVRAGGTLMIPTFAMQATQELLYALHQLFKEGRVPPIPVFIDSPLAIKLTDIYKAQNDFNKATENIVRSGEDISNFPGLEADAHDGRVESDQRSETPEDHHRRFRHVEWRSHSTS